MVSRSRREQRMSHVSDSESSASTSPERGQDDDNDSFMLHPNDSQSSLGGSISRDISPDSVRDFGERCRRSPICRLPAELLIAIFTRLSTSPADLRSCMLVSKDWARNAVGLLWLRPHTDNWQGLHNVTRSIRAVDSYFAYHDLIKRLNLTQLGNQVSDGTILPFSGCKRIERLTLTNCSKLTDLGLAPLLDGNRNLLALDITGLEHITDKTMKKVAQHCLRLQGLNVTNCRKITDDSLEAVAKSCKHVKRLKFNGCTQLTDKSIMTFADNCHSILEIDLHDCRSLEDESVTALIDGGRQLRELRLQHCGRITDNAFLQLPQDATYESLRILDLTDCGELQDAGVQKIITAAPRLRNLVLAKCRQITDRAVMSITKLGKNLHYIHLGHCARITDVGVTQLVKLCNRIRYIDLACCQNLTDMSVQQLAALPKLKRIGLVKCGSITDRSILALAKPKQAGQGGPLQPSSLERVHLSYCTLLSLDGIHALLNNCPRLTHLSLTGVQAFLREELIHFCREAPAEFNDHQRDVFCVFSGPGVGRLRAYLNEEATASNAYDGETTMFDDGGEDGPDPPIGGGVMLGDGAADHPDHQFGYHGVAIGDGHPHPHSQAQAQGGVNVNGLMGAMGATAIDEDEEFGEGSEIMAGD
ncbi:RNI-like protein [Viridothelium virens]|uniref:RNI-like protein n=1 Tax=Viridothelium virens TaxID=1048519 RepID=A0A6A6H193_VIRVR|nr:RNI-like protein [Viridothelium virens]